MASAAGFTDQPPNAVIRSVLPRGVRTVVTIESAGSSSHDRIVIELPADSTYASNDTVTIAVTGTGVTY